MISQGDNIAIGVSGGKDSLALLATLAELRRFYPKKYYLQAITLNPQGAVDVVKNTLYPFYQMGLAACGDVISTLIFAAIVCALFAIVYAVISRSFIKLAKRFPCGKVAFVVMIAIPK